MFLSEARHLGTILQISFLNTTNIKNRFTLRENVCIWPIVDVSQMPSLGTVSLLNAVGLNVVETHQKTKADIVHTNP